MKYTILICSGFLAVAALLAISGCTGDGSPTLLPNADPALRKTSTELAADSAKRAYEADAPKGAVPIARAEYDVQNRKFELANTGDSDLHDVEVWVNQKYVLNVPNISKNSSKALNFEMFYDMDGHHFWYDHGKYPVNTLQIFWQGKMYDVVATLQ
jgi:hypothetical protein